MPCKGNAFEEEEKEKKNGVLHSSATKETWYYYVDQVNAKESLSRLGQLFLPVFLVAAFYFLFFLPFLRLLMHFATRVA